jgi:predicted nucleotidyltransferase
MEDIKERLGDYKYNFFKNLQNYLDTELIFFGSVKRLDYFKNSSDFDIAVITDNVSNTLTRVKTYLHINQNEVKKVYQNFREISPNLIVGYKIKYADVKNNISFDILIYDEKYREVIMKELNESNNIPFYMITILYVLKCIYYNLGLMSSTYYIYIKRIIFSMYQNKKFFLSEKDTARNIVLDNI